MKKLSALSARNSFGAVVGIIVDYRAQALALKNGLYVVKIREEIVKNSNHPYPRFGFPAKNATAAPSP